jgi:hypothetical protein
MSFLKSLFLFLFLSLAIIQASENNETKIPNENKNEELVDKTDEIIDEDIEEIKENVNKSSYRKRPEFDKDRPFNLTYDEMDKMIFCTFIVQETIREKKEDFEAIQKKMNLSTPNPIYEKLGTDMFEKCNNKVDINIVSKFIKNMTYFNNFKMDKSYKALVELDYDKYNNESDLVLTMEQQVLMYKYQRVEDIFRQKRADLRDTIDKDNQKIKIGNLELDNIPSSIKFTAFLGVLAILFGGIFYFLKKLEKKPKDKKKNKKKKIQ